MQGPIAVRVGNMTDAIITWECDNEHLNSVTLSLNDIESEDVDEYMYHVVSSTTFVRDNPCHVCGDTFQHEVDWSFVPSTTDAPNA